MSDRGGSGLRVGGRLVPYNQFTEIDNEREGHFLERFAPGCCSRSFADRIASRLRGFFEHGISRLFGRTPIMDIERTWEQADGAYFEAELLRGLPESFIDGLRRGLYGTSIGCKPVNVSRVRNPGRSAHNKGGLEERTYTEVSVHDISLTARPHYAGTDVALRSHTDDGLIYRSSTPSILVAPAWALPEPRSSPTRDWLLPEPARARRRDYLAGPPDYLL